MLSTAGWICGASPRPRSWALLPNRRLRGVVSGRSVGALVSGKRGRRCRLPVTSVRRFSLTCLETRALVGGRTWRTLLRSSGLVPVHCHGLWLVSFYYRRCRRSGREVIAAIEALRYGLSAIFGFIHVGHLLWLRSSGYRRNSTDLVTTDQQTAVLLVPRILPIDAVDFFDVHIMARRGGRCK